MARWSPHGRDVRLEGMGLPFLDGTPNEPDKVLVMFIAFPKPKGRRFVLLERFKRMRRSSAGDVMTISYPILEVTSHSPLVFRPKASWSKVCVVSTVTNRTVLPKTTQLEISNRELGETGNAFRPWPFD